MFIYICIYISFPTNLYICIRPSAQTWMAYTVLWYVIFLYIRSTDK